MEEISWGQWVFFWRTPEAIKEVNAQGETNFHNIGPLQGHSEWMRLAFVAAALFGAWLRRRPAFREIAPPRALTGPLLVILGYVCVDVLDDLFPHVPWIVTTFSSMSEWVEMLIGLLCLAYVVLARAVRDPFRRQQLNRTRPPRTARPRRGTRLILESVQSRG